MHLIIPSAPSGDAGCALSTLQLELGGEVGSKVYAIGEAECEGLSILCVQSVAGSWGSDGRASQDCRMKVCRLAPAKAKGNTVVIVGSRFQYSQ